MVLNGSLSTLNITPLGAAAAVLLIYPVLKFLYNITIHPLASIPGPRLWAATRLRYITTILRGTLVQDLEILHRAHGPIVRIRPNEVAFAHPDAWNDIHTSRPGHKIFLKDTDWWGPQADIGTGIFTAIDPAEHARIRKVLAPGFTAKALRGQENILQKYVALLIERLGGKIEKAKVGAGGKDVGAEVDMTAWFNYTTFDIIGDLGFGESFDCLQTSRYHPWIEAVFGSIKILTWIGVARSHPLIELLVNKCTPASLKKKNQDHYQAIADKVERRLGWELDRPDFMTHAIKKDGELNMPMKEITATWMGLTTAGSETTATHLTGTLNFLVNNTDKLEKLVREVRGAFTSEGEIRIEGLKELPYLNAVIQEGLRLCSPVPYVFPRRVPEGGDTVCGVWLPGGTSVSVSASALSRSPDYFHKSTSFLPERWLPEASKDPNSPFFNDHRNAVQAFLVGPSNCIGKDLAWAEMRLILGKLVWNYDFEPVEGKSMRWEDLKTWVLVEKKALAIRVKQRAI